MEAATLSWEQVGYKKKNGDLTKAIEQIYKYLLEHLIFLNSELGVVGLEKCEIETKGCSRKSPDFRHLDQHPSLAICNMALG